MTDKMEVDSVSRMQEQLEILGLFLFYNIEPYNLLINSIVCMNMFYL